MAPGSMPPWPGSIAITSGRVPGGRRVLRADGSGPCDAKAPGGPPTGGLDPVTAGAAAPDYRMRAAWAWHPTYVPCTAWPQGFGPVPALPKRPADVFYIHPTTHRGIGAEWNAGWDDAAANAIADSWPLRHQVSAFRGCGRIFAKLR